MYGSSQLKGTTFSTQEPTRLVSAILDSKAVGDLGNEKPYITFSPGFLFCLGNDDFIFLKSDL